MDIASIQWSLQTILKHFFSRVGNIDNIGMAFSAALDHNPGIISLYDRIVFNKVYINDGNSYNNATGIFTAPYDGAYMLSFFIAEFQPGQIVTRLMLDGVNIVDSVAESIDSDHNDHGGNVVILKLNMGQQVWIETYNTDNVHISAAYNYLYDTFSGFLLYGL